MKRAAFLTKDQGAMNSDNNNNSATTALVLREDRQTNDTLLQAVAVVPLLLLIIIVSELKIHYHMYHTGWRPLNRVVLIRRGAMMMMSMI